ncbi:LURP-one-related/scramblase family protein [Sporosarcina sp. Te-1]|uniref:LURP-one-related/scramblase family protein n=1 Tax=Sporosarcina sp. Te-1 TaxID=2818390 RepID=UPI001A9E4EB9|nr:LURP-one-related family protein [Sporosarcina sp. Te-1]QTD43223.1 LURP-one-related family protein [Sporosarcina sp. Te-1]
MKELYIKQKMLNIGGKFTVRDAAEQDIYYVEGSFLQVPKTFTIWDTTQDEVALITKKPFSFLPTFFVDVKGRETVTIKKQFTFLKSNYTIDAAEIEVQGNMWDMTFDVLQHGTVVGTVDKKWFSWGDSYRLQIMNEEAEALLVALVVAIDYVKASQAAASSASV